MTAQERRKLAAFRLDLATLDALQAVKDRDGIPVSVQVRRALDAWLASRGITVAAKATPKRKRARR